MPGPNLIQVRRTSVADREANTITLPDAGTLALNILDGRMFSTNGAVVFEVGANTKNCRVSNSFFVGDGSVNTSANSTQINTSITQLSTALYVGDNVDITTAGWFLGNTTVNVFANSTTIKLANSTVNTHISVPDTVAYSATNYFLHANGSWVQVVGGGGSARVYQAYTATAAQDTFTVSGGYTIGQIDVFENGVHLSNTEYVQNGTTVVLNSPALAGELIEVSGWIAMSSFSPVAGGSDTYIQYNDGGPLGGSAGFTFDDITTTVTVGSSTVNLIANATALKLANSTVNTGIVVPSAAQYAGSYYLHANGTWALVTGATPGGSNTYVQFNDSTALGGTSGFTFDKATNNAVIANTLTVAIVNATVSVNSALIKVGTAFIANTLGAYHTGTMNAASFTTTGFLANTTVVVPASNSSGQTFGNTLSRWVITGNSATFSSTLAATDTTITGFVNATVSVNSAAHTIGSTFIANTLGVYHTGTINAASFTTTGFLANTTVVVPASNSSGQTLGNTISRWVLTANSVTTSGGVSPDSNTLGTALGSTTQRWVLTPNSAALSGALTADTVNAVTSVNSALVTVGTAFVANTTGAYHTGTMNAASHTIGSTFIANTLGAYHTGTINAASHTTTGFLANATHVVPTSNSSGQTFGNTIARWIITANSVITSGGVSPDSNTLGTALGSATQRWVLLANTIESTGLANVSALNVVNQTNTATLFATTSATVGANIVANTTTILVGNSTVNTVIGNTQIAIGNSIVNAVTNSIAFTLANSTVAFSLIKPSAAQVSSADYYPASDGVWKQVTAGATPGGANIQVQFNDSGALGGSAGFTFDKATNNVVMANTLTVGSSTVNVVANSTQIKLANSTVNTHISVPTSGEYSATNYFLHANGSWVLVTAGAGGGAVSRVYQSYTATGGQTTYTVTGDYTIGMIEVFENGVHLANTEYTQNGSTVVLNVGSLAGAIIEVAGYKDVGNLTSPRVYQAFTATSGQTLFTLSAPYTANNIAVYYNGVHLAPTDYTQNAGTGTVTLADAANTGALIEVEGWNAMTTITSASTPTGSNTWVQYNDSGAMGASAGFTFDQATNTAVVANTLTVASAFTANGLGAYHTGTINATSFTVGALWTANSILVNANAINCRNQVNTATLFVATSIDVGANVDLSTTQLFVGNSITNTTVGNNYIDIGNSVVNVFANSTILKVANSTSIANLSPSTLTIGATTVNSTVIDSAGSLLSANIQINPQTGTTYTLQADNSGKLVTCNNASAITVTVPAGLPIGFRTMVMQIAAGAVTLSNTGQTGASIFSRTAGFTTSSQWATASVSEVAANTYVIDGSI